MNNIYQYIPQEYRAFFLIENAIDLSHTEVQKSLKAFSEAVSILFSHINPTKVVTVIFAGREVTLEIHGIHIHHRLIEPTLHLTLNHNTIYLDIPSAILHTYEEQVAGYLEELVHAFMNTANEPLTHQIVEWLYPKVKFDGFTFKPLV